MKSQLWLVFIGLFTATAVQGQGVSPGDPAEAARFDAAVRAATTAGFAHAAVVGHGDSSSGLFALLATRGDSGVLIVLVQPVGRARAAPVVLERDRSSADLGVRGVAFNPFLGSPELTDIAVSHEPLMLETSRRFELHHVLRRTGATIELACQFPGSATSSSSKGIGSITGTRRVNVALVAPGPPLRFRVGVVDETTEQSGRQPARVSAHTETASEYELPSAGSCREHPVAAH